ncbi:hypothetical protein ARMSODRAFT_978466 [Armillaria solidipes]|uniref:Uncharacterized protein n=1 Tax=Armillaria solidipes TaxID=1076256 RepID=A0A2H3B379_9AGAR|nr:hypothetical protein ARMSODRAFT_978466 [Armillaria solidipes]
MIAVKKRVADISRRGQVERLKLHLFGTGPPALLNLLGLTVRSGLRTAFAPNSLSRSEFIEKYAIVFPIFFSLNVLNIEHHYPVPEGRNYRRYTNIHLYLALGLFGTMVQCMFYRTVGTYHSPSLDELLQNQPPILV